VRFHTDSEARRYAVETEHDENSPAERGAKLSTQMSSPLQPQICRNSQCLHVRRSWLWRLQRPRGIWLNKDWYCSTQCFEQGAIEVFRRFNFKLDRPRTARYRLPLGLLLLSKGMITGQHLQEALKAQRDSRAGRLGEWLRQRGVVTEQQITAALGVQWGIPVFHLAQSAGFAECARMTPLPILEASHMALVHYLPTSQSLYVAFSDGIDFGALRALEQMLECNTQPCVIGGSEMAETLESLRQIPRASETVLDRVRDPVKLAAATREWAESNEAERVRAVLAPEHVWVRLENSTVMGHLLFPLIPPQVVL
jgi:hypothetical protein